MCRVRSDTESRVATATVAYGDSSRYADRQMASGSQHKSEYNGTRDVSKFAAGKHINVRGIQKCVNLLLHAQHAENGGSTNR